MVRTVTEALALGFGLALGLVAAPTVMPPGPPPHPNVLEPGKPGAWDDGVVYLPRVARNLDGSVYREPGTGRALIAYSGSGDHRGLDNDRIGLMTTTDFRHFKRYSKSRPIIGFGRTGRYDPSGASWNGTDVAADSFLYTGGRDGMPRFLIFHEGNRWPNGWGGPPRGDEVSIGVATSEDGYNWRKRRRILIPGRIGASDSGDTYAFTVMYQSDRPATRRWRAWYTGHVNGGGWAIMEATAPRYDGPWTKRPGGYSRHAAGVTQVWRERDGSYRMVMDDWPTLNRVSLHASPDGTHWHEVRTLMTAASVGWVDSHIYGSERVWDARTRRWRVLYSASNGDDSIQGIGQVTLG